MTKANSTEKPSEIAAKKLPPHVVEALRDFNYTDEQFEELLEVQKVYEVLSENLQKVESILGGRPFCERSILAESSPYKDDLERLDGHLEFLKTNRLIAGVADNVHITGRPKKLVVLNRETKDEMRHLWNSFLLQITEEHLNPNLKILKQQLLQKRWLSRKTRFVYHPSAQLDELQIVPQHVIAAELNHLPDMTSLKRHWNEFYIEQDQHPLRCLCGRDVLDTRQLTFPEQI